MEPQGSTRGGITRRRLLGAAAALAAGGGAPAGSRPPSAIGAGPWSYAPVEDWGAPPEGMAYEWGCAVVVDSRDRVYVHTRARRSVLVFDRRGSLLRDFGGEFAGTGHGLYLQKAGRDEFLYFSDHPRHMVVKTDLDGRVLLRIGRDLPEENATNRRFPLNHPTDVAVAPNGDIFVCEGYGGNVVHRFDALGRHRQTIGRPGAGPGEFNTCHGLWVDTRRDEPELYVADRNNRRIQVFTLDGRLLREVRGGIRQPCCFYGYRDVLFVPDLAGAVTILDRRDRVLARLGSPTAPAGAAARESGGVVDGAGAFQAPHAVAVDSRGDLYVVEWVPDARLRKFRRTPTPV